MKKWLGRAFDRFIFLDSRREAAERVAQSRAQERGRLAMRTLLVADDLARGETTRDIAWPLHVDALRLAREARAEAGLDVPASEQADVADRDYAGASRRVRELLDGIELRTVRELAWEARLRVAMVIISVLVSVQIFTMWVVAPRNLALGARVTTGLMPSESDVDAVSPLVNGIIEEHTLPLTKHEANPRVVVDLGRHCTIKRVVVYGRGDRETAEFLPLVVEVSTDGITYVELGRRKELFTAFVPWQIKRTVTGVRYVRLTTPKNGRIALSELEVYGRY